MDAMEQFRQDARLGRVDVDRLIEVNETLQRQLDAALRELKAAKQCIEELKQKIGGPNPPAAGSAKIAEPYSMQAEEKRQQERANNNPPKLSRKARRRGRLTTDDKIKLAQRTEAVFPEGVPEADCWLSHTRVVWRLEDGRAILVAYQIYRGPKNQYGSIPGVLGRGEFGLEVVVQVAYMVYIVGLSFDKVCMLLQFLQNLPLKKSQADSLLRRLATHWENEFEILCTLLANSMVVHADETSWSINSVWALLSEKARVLLFGVHKDGDTLAQILDPSSFKGIVVSDDAAVYEHFSKSQKCWAHLLRKAIKLTLQEPNNTEYRAFTDSLLEIYRKACRIQRDGRMKTAGRAEKVKSLDDEILALCMPMWQLELPPLDEGPENDFRKLVNEVMRVMLNQELFTFVTAEPTTSPNGVEQPVSGTNNEAERTIRPTTEARKTGRTNKTLYGARRQSILVSVLESLRVYLKSYTLANVLAEIECWQKAGRSCFAKQLQKLQLQPPSDSILNKLLPKVPIPEG